MKKQIWQAISQAPVITIFRHKKPDGDAYGSQMGLKELIKTAFPEKTVYVLGTQSNHWGKIMGSVDEGVTNEAIQNSLALVLDTANEARVDDERYKLAQHIIKIDHHLFVEKFGELEWIDTSTMATCEMLTVLAIENNLTISKAAATFLYCGLITDSGRFLFANTSAQTLWCASKLIEAGVEIIPLYDYIYTSTENEVRFRGYCQLNYQKTEHGVAYMFITEEIKKQFGINENKGAGFVNAISNIEGIHIHVFFSQQDDGQVKIEFRSKDYPVNEVATKYGGGGHKLAAGTIVDSWETVKQVLQDLDDVCKEANHG